MNDPAAQQAEVDLHMHSTASDGALPPAQVVAAARAAGLAAIALTDHDTMGGVGEAVLAADAVGIRIVPGVELSAHDGGEEIHILALHVTRPGPLESRLAYFRSAREHRARKIVERLNSVGVTIDYESVMTEAAGGSVGRPHVARAMIKGGAVRDSREAFDKYLASGRPAFVEKERLEIRDAIEITHAAGAIAVWAHPGAGGRRERVEPLVEMGLDGLEVRHPSHNSEDMKRLTALADFFGIVFSGGSDWHGAREGQRTIGCMHVPAEWLAKQDAAVAKRYQAEVA
ncbi:MAG: PHP domain-containing protein [Gemmatimonadales bacterium]